MRVTLDRDATSLYRQKRFSNWLKNLSDGCRKILVSQCRVSVPMYITLFVLKKTKRASAFVGFASYGKSLRKIYRVCNIFLPAEEVERAYHGLNKKIDLLSGGIVEVATLTWLKYVLTHELIHCFRPLSFKDFSEGLAVKLSLDKLLDSSLAMIGEETVDDRILAVVVLSKLLVDANIIGCASIRTVEDAQLPYKLEPAIRNMVQKELDLYWQYPEKVQTTYASFKELGQGDDEDSYARGFFRLIRDPDLCQSLIES